MVLSQSFSHSLFHTNTRSLLVHCLPCYIRTHPVLSWICHQGMNQHSCEGHRPSLCQSTMPQCHTPGCYHRKEIIETFIFASLNQPHDITAPPMEPQPVLPVDTTCGHAWPSWPRTRTTLWQGCRISCRTTSFDWSYTIANKINLIQHSFLKLSMQNTSLQWQIVLDPMINGPPVCIDASYHCNALMVSNGHKICTRATCYYIVGCDFSCLSATSDGFIIKRMTKYTLSKALL